MIRLDIIADIACPWCYVGKGFLDQALTRHPAHPFRIEWHPFMLDPSMPAGGMDREEYMRLKFGDTSGILRAHAPLLEAGEKAGVTFDLPAIRRAPNTLDAHRLIWWAGLEDKQAPVVDALYKAYWREGRDIGDAAELAKIAGEQGMDPALVARLLASDADRAGILSRDAHARKRGVRAVPAFIVADQHVLSGAQPAELWEQVITELSAPKDATLH